GEAKAVPPRFRDRYLRPESGAVSPVPSLRGGVSFVEHDLMGQRLAPPEALVAWFDVVLCRNGLMYLDARFRAGAFDRLTAVVRTGGALVLGTAEALDESVRDRFRAFVGTDPLLRLFERLGTGKMLFPRRAAP